jgi:hypothetical protein
MSSRVLARGAEPRTLRARSRDLAEIELSRIIPSSSTIWQRHLLKRCFAGLKGFGWTLCERSITGSRRECRTETEMPRLSEYLRNFKD